MEVSNGGVDHSVLVRFMAPGSFSCNLREKRKTSITDESYTDCVEHPFLHRYQNQNQDPQRETDTILYIDFWGGETQPELLFDEIIILTRAGRYGPKVLS